VKKQTNYNEENQNDFGEINLKQKLNLSEARKKGNFFKKDLLD
jgi:hypothetical protein